MLITSRHSSEKNSDLIAKHPRLASQLAHWTEAVFLIISGSATPDTYVMAVNVARPLSSQQLESDLKMMRVWGKFQRAIDAMGDSVIGELSHYIGGPMGEDEPCAMLEIKTSSSSSSSSSSSLSSSASAQFARLVRALTPSDDSRPLCIKHFPETGQLYFANLEDILLLAREQAEATHQACEIKVFWGYASWGATQLLSELARRSWGLSEQWDERQGLKGLKTGSLSWVRTVDHMSIAKASEFSREQY